MKAIFQLSTFFILLYPVPGKCQHTEDKHPSKSNSRIEQNFRSMDSFNTSGKSFWGELNAGYSNDGPAGSLEVCYRIGKIIFGARYYKSHVCYDDDKKRDYFLNDGNSDNHKTIESLSIFSGLVFPGKLAPSLSAGVSWCRFKYVSTTCIEHDVTLPRIWETIMNKDYKDEMLSSRTIHSIGIPLELQLHFASKHFAGLDVGIKAELNMHHNMISAGLGIRLGNVLHRHLVGSY